MTTVDRVKCPGYGHRAQMRKSWAGGEVERNPYGCKFKASPDRADGRCKICGNAADRDAAYTARREAGQAARAVGKELLDEFEALGVRAGLQVLSGSANVLLPFDEARAVIARCRVPATPPGTEALSDERLDRVRYLLGRLKLGEDWTNSIAHLAPDLVAEIDRLRAVPATTDSSAKTCGCYACNPKARWMVLCPDCGDKRCPHAADHRNACRVAAGSPATTGDEL